MATVVSPPLYAAVNAAAAIAFFVLLFIGAATTAGRAIYYRVQRLRRPRLLTRDVVFLGGFAISFGLILVVRLTGIGVSLKDNVLWAIATDLPGVGALAVYVWYEIFVIERRDR